MASRVPFYLPRHLNPQGVVDEDGPGGRRVISLIITDEYGNEKKEYYDGGPNTGGSAIYIASLGEVDREELTDLILAYREKHLERQKRNKDKPRRTSQWFINALRAKYEEMAAQRVHRSTYGYGGATRR